MSEIRTLITNQYICSQQIKLTLSDISIWINIRWYPIGMFIFDIGYWLLIYVRAKARYYRFNLNVNDPLRNGIDKLTQGNP